MRIIKEFKEFVNRGNVMDLAVAVIIGSAVIVWPSLQSKKTLSRFFFNIRYLML